MASDGTPSYTLRKVTASDHTFVREAHHAGLRPWIEQTWDWNDEHQDQIHAERMERRATHMQVLCVGGRDAGYMDVDRGGRPWKLNSIVLLPRFQANGIGTRVVRDLQAAAQAEGVPLTLQVLRVNPARRLYERLGFVPTGQSETHIQMQWAPTGTTSE